MSLDVAQNASAVTELIFAGLKVTGYGVVMICSVLGSHTIESHWNTEKRMAETVAHWRNVLSHLDEKKKDEIGRENIRCMDSRLYQMEGRLSFLEVDLRRASLWSRTVGEHASRVRKLKHLIDTADKDLTAQTEKALREDDAFFEPESLESIFPQPPADPQATSVGAGQATCIGRGHVATHPCVELAPPSQTAQFTAVPQYMPPYIPYGPDYGDDIV